MSVRCERSVQSCNTEPRQKCGQLHDMLSGAHMSEGSVECSAL